MQDIEGNEIQVGDLVWYATTSFGAKACFTKGTISKITDNGNVKMINVDRKYSSQDTFLCSRPEQQILLIESRTRKVLFEKQ